MALFIYIMIYNTARWVLPNTCIFYRNIRSKALENPRKKKQDILCDSNIPNHQRAYIRIKGNEVI